MSAEEQVCVFYAHGEGYLDGLNAEDVWPFLMAFLKELRSLEESLLYEINGGKTLSSRMKARLDKVLKRTTIKKPRADDIKQRT